MQQDNVLTSWEAIEGSRPIGTRVLLLDDDGSRAAAGVAIALLDRGHEVAVATRWNALFPFTLYGLDLAHVYGSVFARGLTYRLNVWASAIEGGTVRLFNLYTGQEEPPVEVDTVVLTAARPTPSSTSPSGARWRTSTGSATASRCGSSTTRSTRATSPAASCSIRTSATSTRASWSARPWDRPSRADSTSHGQGLRRSSVLAASRHPNHDGTPTSSA